MHPMRRSDREQSLEFTMALIDSCTNGVMAVQTGEEFPYCLPLSFVRKDNCLYFHCAKQGRKLDLLRADPHVCVTFVGGDVPAFLEPDEYTTYFSSAIVTGVASEVTDREEMIEALRLLCAKLLPESMHGFLPSIESTLPATAVWRVDIAEARGKQKKRPG